ncbi:MAG: phage integrase SAM-like domain-containing protein [Bacteroidetes bacterium]|nr:phage integrase SAM-like domain-containing protein [Bacteroidota bacterium]
MKYNIKFILEKRQKNGELIIIDVPIIAQITYNSKRIFYFTGYRVDYLKFDFNKQQVKRNTLAKHGANVVQYNVINNVLTQIKSKVIDIFNNISLPPEKEFIIKELDIVCGKIIKLEPVVDSEKDIFFYYENYIKNVKVVKGRLNGIKSTKNHLYRFSIDRDITLTFDNITAEILKDFESYLRDDVVKKGDNTINSIMKRIKAFWNYSIINFEDLNIKYPFKKGENGKGYAIPKEKYGEPIFLSIKERDLLFNKEIPDKQLETIRDIFVFQCFIGARIGDFSKLTRNNIDKNNVLSYLPRKTIKNKNPKAARIPLTPKAIEILKKYDMPDNSLLPFFSDSKYNESLKDLFKFVGIDRKVERLNSITGQKEHVAICDIASSHLARRTFVGNLVNKKTPMHVVTKMSGHVAGSRSVQRYYTVDDETLKDYVNLID